MKRTLLLPLLLVGILPAVLTSNIYGLTGPVFPPPLGVSFTELGVPGDSGRSSGRTWQFSNTVLSASTPVYWGATNGGVALSFASSTFTNWEVMSFNSSLSDLSSGLAVWNGETRIPDDGRRVFTRCTLAVKATGGAAISLESAAGLGLPTGIGGVLRVLSPALSWDANVRFDASFDASTGFLPSLDFYDANTLTNSTAFSTFGAGFYFEDAPPVISPIANQLTQMNNPIGPIPFTIGDIETNAEALTLSASSSNLPLVPVGSIVFGGAGSNRTVTITPATSQYGSTTITIRVSDAVTNNSTSFVLTVNSPPQLQANDGLTVNWGGAGAITDFILRAVDAESGSAQVVFTVAPRGEGGSTRNGALRLNGAPLQAGSTFTQADINSGLLTYQNGSSCDLFDDFSFNVTDGNGGVTPTGQYTTYTFHIRILLATPPVAVNGSASVPLNVSYRGIFSGTNPDCTNQPVTFSIVTNGNRGTAVLSNAGTGEFVYTPNAGATGPDTVTFQVFDGFHQAAAPGIFTLLITNQPPVAADATLNGFENQVLTGLLVASDPDLPPQALIYRVVANGTKGSAVITNAATGGFTYTPLPGRFGVDSFTFKVNDDSLDSALATITVWVQPILLPGRMAFTAQVNSTNSIVCVTDLRTSDLGLLSAQGNLHESFGLAFEQDGSVLVADQKTGLIRINPTNGAQTMVVSNSLIPYSFGVAVETNGNILLASGANGIGRFTTLGAQLGAFSKGNLQFPFGVVQASGGDIFVSDLAAFASQLSQTKVDRLNPADLSQSVLSSVGYLTAPAGLCMEQNGSLLVANAGSFPFVGMPDSIVRISTTDGTQTVVTSSNLLFTPVGLAVNQAGEILVANQNGCIVKVDPFTGFQSYFLPPGMFPTLGGIAAVPGVLPPPSMTSIAKTAQGFLLRFSGVPGQSYQLKRSTNFLSWPTLTTLSAPIDGLMQYEDTNAPAGAAYYRAVME